MISSALMLSRNDIFDFSFLENPRYKVSEWASRITGTFEWISEFVDSVLSIKTGRKEHGSLYSIVSMMKTGSISKIDACIFQSRHDVKILANILNVDHITTEILLDATSLNENEEQFKEWLDGKAKHLDLPNIWNLFMQTNEGVQQKYGYKFAKIIEKSAKLDKASLTKLLNSMQRYAVGSPKGRRSANLPSDYSKLNEKSILRETLNQIM